MSYFWTSAKYWSNNNFFLAMAGLTTLVKDGRMTEEQQPQAKGANRKDGHTPLLRARGLTKTFGLTVAVDSVDLTVDRGQVVAIVGENGAGKSTLKNMLSGILEPDSGTIELDGQVFRHLPLGHIGDLGIGAVHQEFSLFGSLSVAENICINDLPGQGDLVSWREIHTIAQQHLDMIGADLDLDAAVESLSTGEQQMVEIAKALRQASRLLILDEPTTSLTDPERERLYGIIQRLRERQLGIIFISHFIDEVYEVADFIVVLRDGQRVGGGRPSDLPRRKLESLMVGRPVSELGVDIGTPSDEVILKVEGLYVEPVVKNISFSLHRGEILGLHGLMGAGRTETLEALYGLRPSTGKVWLEGRLLAQRSPASMKSMGVAFVPEDRRRHGLFGNRPLRENLSAAAVGRMVQRFIPGIGFRGERENAREVAEALNVVYPSLESPIRVLSGGNQQKALLGRWLQIEPRVAMFDEPTRGVDIGAKSEIHGLIADLARSGTGVLLVTSELPELMGLAHRIIVLNKGRVVAEFEHADFDARKIIERAASEIEEVESYGSEA